jgi:hypothetical protein
VSIGLLLLTPLLFHMLIDSLEYKLYICVCACVYIYIYIFPPNFSVAVDDHEDKLVTDNSLMQHWKELSDKHNMSPVSWNLGYFKF